MITQWLDGVGLVTVDKPIKNKTPKENMINWNAYLKRKNSEGETVHRDECKFLVINDRHGHLGLQDKGKSVEVRITEDDFPALMFGIDKGAADQIIKFLQDWRDRQ